MIQYCGSKFVIDMVRYILLSYKLTKTSQLYGTIPRFEIIPDKRISNGDTSNTSFLKLHNHSGTHVDAPKHFWDEGKSIADFDLSELIFRSPHVVECSKSKGEMINTGDLNGHEHMLEHCDILLFRTGFWKERSKDVYRTDNPGIAPEVARSIRSRFGNIRCIGIDSISVSSYSNRELGRETHNLLLQKGNFASEPVLLIEDMDLSYNNLKMLYEIIVSPLMVEGLDSSPCTVIGVIEKNKTKKP